MPKSLRIGIAARGLSEKSGGVKQYIESLLSVLLEIDKINQYVIYYNTVGLLGTFSIAEEKVLNSKIKIIWDYLLLPSAARRDKIDVMFFPKNVLPFFIPCKSVTVNLDFGYFIKSLNEYKFFDQLYMRTMMVSSAKRADSIIAISQHTKKDIINFTSVQGDKITVIHLAADKKYHPITHSSYLESIRIRYRLPLHFIFHCGSLSPRKNISSLIKAFNLIKHKIPHQLVFTAGRTWKDKPVNNLIRELDLTDRIVKLGHVSKDDMPAMYNLADLHVYPSIYEGFGLPVLEAMACGCPAITSNRTSLPEVAGEAALMVDPDNVEALSQVIYKVLSDEHLRQEMKKKGFEQAKKFNWDKSACRTIEVFDKVGREGRGSEYTICK